MNKKSDMNQFEKIEELLLKADLDSDKYEDLILNRMKYKIETGTIKSNTEREEKTMKKKFSKPSRVLIITLTTLMLGVSAAYATDTLSTILAFFKIGNTEITQYGETQTTTSTNPEEEQTLEWMQEGYKGKLFDKSGKEVLYGTVQDYYTSDGKKITGMGVKDLPDGSHDFIITTEENDENYEKPLTLEEVKKVADSDIKIPNYLPKGYTFKEGYTSFNGAGVNLAYENASQDTITILASSTKEATNGVASTEEVTETSIDGKKVLISGDAAFWENKGVDYQLYWNLANSNDVLTIDMKELTKIVESMK